MPEESRTVIVEDLEQNERLLINNPVFYGPSIPLQNQSYQEHTRITNQTTNKISDITFTYNSKPQAEHELAMWETLNQFEKDAWSTNNVGLKSGFDCIDNAFNGGIYPGFIIIAGDSNIGKSALITDLAWNMATMNSNVYVMDFSLDDSIKDKLSRVAAYSGKVVINAVKVPLKYTQYPLMLIRRKNAIINIRNNVERYRVYDSSFTTFIEDIEEEVQSKLIYFDSNNINKKVVVFIDNFHDLNIREEPGLSDKDKYDELAQRLSDLAIKHDIPIICSAEFRKLNSKKRPDIDSIRESVKIKYEAKAVLLCYNEVHYLGQDADVYYMVNNNPYKQPIFEVQFVKNKFHSYKGRAYFQFYPEMALLRECDKAATQTYNNLVYN